MDRKNILFTLLDSWGMEKDILKYFYLLMEKEIEKLCVRNIPLEIELIYNEFSKTSITIKIKFLSEKEIEYKQITFSKEDTIKSLRLKNSLNLAKGFSFAPYIPLVVSTFNFLDPSPNHKEEISFSEFFNTIKLFTK